MNGRDDVTLFINVVKNLRVGEAITHGRIFLAQAVSPTTAGSDQTFPLIVRVKQTERTRISKRNISDKTQLKINGIYRLKDKVFKFHLDAKIRIRAEGIHITLINLIYLT